MYIVIIFDNTAAHAITIFDVYTFRTNKKPLLQNWAFRFRKSFLNTRHYRCLFSINFGTWPVFRLFVCTYNIHARWPELKWSHHVFDIIIRLVGPEPTGIDAYKTNCNINHRMILRPKANNQKKIMCTNAHHSIILYNLQPTLFYNKQFLGVWTLNKFKCLCACTLFMVLMVIRQFKIDLVFVDLRCIIEVIF